MSKKATVKEYNVTSGIEFEKFKVGDKVGYYIDSERIREIIGMDKRRFYRLVNMLYDKNEPRYIIKKNNHEYISKYGYEILLMFFLKWNRNHANIILGKFENKYSKGKKLIDRPNSTLQPGTEELSRRVINGRVYLSSNSMATELQVNPTKFIKEFERLYKGNMNGVERLSKDKHGKVLAFLVNENMFDYVITKFEYNQKGYEYIKELYKQVD